MDSEGGSWGEEGGGEFRPNEWKPGMCVGEGGKGANRGRSPSPSARGRTFGGQKRGGKLCVGRSDPLLWRLFFFLLLLAVGCAFLVAAYLQEEEWK